MVSCGFRRFVFVSSLFVGFLDGLPAYFLIVLVRRLNDFVFGFILLFV